MMQHCVEFHLILLILVMVMVYVTEAKKWEMSLTALKKGQRIKGKGAAEFKVGCSDDCAIRCLMDNDCQAYQYQHKGTRTGNCILIHSTNAGGEQFGYSDNSETFMKASLRSRLTEIDVMDTTIFSGQNMSVLHSNYTEVETTTVEEIEITSAADWNPPSNWTGPSAVLYQSFDSSDGFILKEGTQNVSVPVPLASGKVNNALSFNRTKSQWVDLGIHTEACMTNMTCGAAGGAISLWMKVIDCPSSFRGIVSSRQSRTRGSVIYCTSGGIWFRVYLSDGYFYVPHTKPTGWTHVVGNYIGPNDGEGIRMFIDGAEVANDTTKSATSKSPGVGRVVVGRRFTDCNEVQYYASVQVDELIYFNVSLTSDNVQSIYNSA